MRLRISVNFEGGSNPFGISAGRRAFARFKISVSFPPPPAPPASHSAFLLHKAGLSRRGTQSPCGLCFGALRPTGIASPSEPPRRLATQRRRGVSSEARSPQSGLLASPRSPRHKIVAKKKDAPMFLRDFALRVSWGCPASRFYQGGNALPKG